MPTYRMHGLCLHSEVILPELVPAPDETPDVIIRYGDVPADLDSPLGRGVLYQAKAGEFLLKLDDIATYWVCEGTTITIDPAPGSVDSDVRVFLYGSAMGALLHQRGVLALHGSAVATPHGAVVFVGHSGNGKSTLAGALVQRGYGLLSDDVCTVSTVTGEPLVQPALPSMRLWADMLRALELEESPRERVRTELEKYLVPVGEQYAQEAVPLVGVYELTTSNTDELWLKPVEDGKKVEVLVRHTYRSRFLDHLGVSAQWSLHAGGNGGACGGGESGATAADAVSVG